MKYTTSTLVDADLLDSFYNDSSLTLEGLDLNSIEDYANYLNENFGLKDDTVFHIIDGKYMNDYYELTGTNCYPNDLHIIVVKLDNIINLNKLMTKRFTFGGRWFDDVVNNSKQRQCC